jgi:hypothetical protein
MERGALPSTFCSYLHSKKMIWSSHDNKRILYLLSKLFVLLLEFLVFAFFELLNLVHLLPHQRGIFLERFFQCILQLSSGLVDDFEEKWSQTMCYVGAIKLIRLQVR